MPENGEQRIKILSEIRDPFGRVPHIIIDFYGPAMGQAGWLYTLLTRFQNNESSETYVSLKTLANTGGIDEKTAKKYVEHLENLGLIRVERDSTYAQEGRRARPNNYTLLLPPLPPPDSIREHFPTDWKPPDRALKALEKVQNLLSLSRRPQADDDTQGVGGESTPTPPSLSPPVGGEIPPSRGKNSPQKGARLPSNKPFLTSITEQEKTTTYEHVVVPFWIEETCMELQENITPKDLQSLWEKALKVKGGDEEAASSYFREKLEIAADNIEKIKGLIPWLTKALEADFKPSENNTDKQQNGSTPHKKLREAHKKEALEFERKRAAELEASKKAPKEEILDLLNKTAAIMPKENALKIVREKYSENKNLEEAIKMFEQQGGQSGV